jgi:pimeloyl-ACP methyl ester carboxylesterase
MPTPPLIRFVTTRDGVRIGYSVHGDGPPLVFVRGWISHLEAMWENPATRAFFTALAERFTVVRYDTRGQGVSDRNVSGADLEALVADIETVVDHLDLQDMILYGQTFGGPLAIAYASRQPYRVSRLILDGTFAKMHVPDPEAHEAFLNTLESLWPHSISLIAQLTTPDPSGVRRIDAERDWSTRALTAQMAGYLYRLGSEIDVRHLLPSIAIPTLVLHRRGSRSISRSSARELAAELPQASLVLLEGSAHNPWDESPQLALDAIGEFLGVELRLPDLEPEPVAPMAILFTDMEASTAMTSRLGDARAQELVRTHDAVVRQALRDGGGAEVKHTGDGIMASFRSVSAAVECAAAIQLGLRRVEAPFRVKIGIDAGEPLYDGSVITGTVVQSARRIVDRAEPGQILVSDVVRRLVAGKTFPFLDRGRAVLKGLPERVRLFEVVWTQDPDGA